MGNFVIRIRIPPEHARWWRLALPLRWLATMQARAATVFAVLQRIVDDLGLSLDRITTLGLSLHYGSVNLRVARSGQTDVKRAPPTRR